MATISKRGSRWFAQVRRKGFPSISKTFSSSAAANAWALAEEAQILSGEYTPPLTQLRQTKLSDVIDRYIAEVTPSKRSADTERTRLRKIARDPIADLTLADLDSSHFAAYRDRRLRSVKAGTICRELSLLHHALEIARREWGLKMPTNPLDLVSRPRLRNARNRRFEAGEAAQLFAALSKSRCRWLLPIARLAVETGMRRGEILDLTWRNVDLAAGLAHIPRTKTDTPRTIPLTDAAIAVIDGLARSEDRLFPITPNATKLAWTRAVKRAGLANFRFHDLRHEAICRFFELGLSMPEVALISGHRDPRMLFRYTHLRPTELASRLRGLTWDRRDRPSDEARLAEGAALPSAVVDI